MIVNKYTNGGGSGSGSTEGYWNSAQTKTYVDSADTVVYASATSYADAAIAGIDLSNYALSADVETLSAATMDKADKAYVDSAITGVQDQLDVIDQVIPAAITDLNERVDEISGQSVDLSAFYTSAQTEEAISAATSGKADKQSVTANPDYMRFPLWNNQGIITGYKGPSYWYDTYYYLNGSSKGKIITTNAVGFGDIYAPTTPGNAGDILVSTGNGAPVWSAMPAADVTKAYVDSAVTEVSDHLYEVEEVTASAITYLNGLIAEISGTTPDLSAYWTSAQTKTYADSAATIAYNSAATYINDVELVMSSALNEFHTQIEELSARTSPDVSSYWTSAQTKTYVDSAITGVQDQIDTMDEVVSAAINDLNGRVATISAATQDMVTSTDVRHLVKLTQAEYDVLTPKDPYTFYIIVNSN